MIGMIFPILPLRAGEPHPASIVEVKPADLGFDLPRAILNVIRLSQLQAPEFKNAFKDMGTFGADAEGNLGNTQVYRAADGTLFCCQNWGMALWVRRKDSWECLISGIRVTKTFGGAPPRLPVLYLGKEYFAFSQTAPGEIKQKSDDRFPVALAITYLLNSSNGEIVKRSEAFRYDQNPPVKVPPEWYPLIGVKPLPEN